MAAHSRSRPRWGGAWGVSAIGAALLVAALAYGGRQFSTDALALYPLVEVGMVVTLCGTILGTGYWLHDSEFTDGDLWRIAIWVGLGIILLVGLTVWQLLTQVSGGAELEDPLLTLVVTQTVGATAGLLVGLYHVQSLRNARAAENAAAAAEEAQAVQEQLAFVHDLVRHHLRNGMHVIQSYTRLLDEHVDDSGAAHLETIERRSQRLVRLVDEMAPLATAIDPDDRQSSVNVRALLERETSHFTVTHPDCRIDVSGPDDVLVRADSLLSAAIETLLRGVIERSAVSGPTVDVEVSTADGQCHIEMAASGPALDGGIDHHLLTSSQRGPTADESAGDTDLHVAREVVERYDGELTVDDRTSRPRFVLTVPIDDADQ